MMARFRLHKGTAIYLTVKSFCLAQSLVAEEVLKAFQG